jgi:hypothetical protein
MRAEESLLPYRAGPTEAANMSSAINGLAAGGNPQGPSAAAGVHFQPSDFTFNAPDFKSIAKQAASAALSGLTKYRPVAGSYQTADYSGINLPSSATMASAPVASSGGRYAGPAASAAPREYTTAGVRLRLFGASPRLAQSPDLCYANPGGLRVSPRSRTYHPRSPARWV